jgi:hypothetical protein
MGLDYGLESYEKCFPRKHRWIFMIPDVSADGSNSLPPSKSARPNLAFKEMEVQHLNETIYYPSKPDWKPITLTLYDIGNKSSPVFDWIKEIYDPKSGSWKAPVPGRFIREATLTLYSGCGDELEKWTFDNVWPQQIDFHDLDMGNAEITMVDITLRYSRAYISS